MRPIILLSLLFLATVSAAATLREAIAGMLIFGMQGRSVDVDPALAETIRRYGLGGVILFGKNISGPRQLRGLTDGLRRLSAKPLLIAVDQEGGRVDRLAKLPGMHPVPSAKEIAQLPPETVSRIYNMMAADLARLGFNCNFAPVVDLAKNPANRVIVRNGRSYGADPERVVATAKRMIDADRRHGILSTLKHFPGHGSSRGDSHLGFTDVSGSWSAEELQPFAKLIEAGEADMIMSAHIYNRRLDPRYPATLSRRTLTGLLRKRLGFSGVIVTDDMQMGAIRQNYPLAESIALAIDAGADMLLFGNQLQRPVDPMRVIGIIEGLVRSGRISPQRIRRSNRRIARLMEKIAHAKKPNHERGDQ